MVITYKNISNIKFPVYELESGNWSRSDGLLFLEGSIIDDRNMPGATLGIRRIQTPYKELYPLKKSLDNFRGLLKSYSKHFIDSNGTPFIYEKTKYAKLKYYRIKKIVKKESRCVLWLYNVKNAFVIPRPPPDNVRYAGILHYENIPWILYEYSEELLKDTRRKV